MAYFIIGLPGEDRESIKRTIKVAKEIKCDYASFGYATADIGTELRKESLLKGWIIDSLLGERLDSSTSPTLKTDKLSEKELKKLKHAAYRQFYIRPSYIIKKLLEVESLGDIKLLLEEGGLLLKRNIL